MCGISKFSAAEVPLLVAFLNSERTLALFKGSVCHMGVTWTLEEPHFLCMAVKKVRDSNVIGL